MSKVCKKLFFFETHGHKASPQISTFKQGKNSDLLSLNFKSSNSQYARNILDEVINVFNNDGVRDRQLIHKRTIDFVNDRYKYLSSELK